MKLLFTGDACLARLDLDAYTVGPKLAAAMREADAVIGNLESPLTNTNETMENQSLVLKHEPKSSALLSTFDVVSLANNHILDYTWIGLSDTIRFLDGEGIHHCGAGMTEEEAIRPAVIEKDGFKVAIFGCSRWYVGTDQEAGCVSDRSPLLVQEIKKYKHNGCFVIVMPHWNYEYVHLPSPESRKLARKWIRAGADMIVGSHPHVIQSMEQVEGKPVFYSLGNFAFYSGDQYADIFDFSKLNDGLVVTVLIDNQGNYSCESLPVTLQSDQTELAEGKDRSRLIDLLHDISVPLRERWSDYRRKFYHDAAAIAAKETRAFKSMAKERGLMSILSRLHRVRLQDIMILLHTRRAKDESA